ncbi:MAG: helix-turn-helix transcriptional regulator [Lachnospiraceae bacterium]|nr:helix-turn-helix transcriptional regulator [Lachnospiraceae bacterium]
MNERIKILRKTLKLTQEEFANAIGAQRATIANYEKGRRVPINTAISLICTKFNVNEDWLRTGEGEMFITRDRSEIITDFMTELLKDQEFKYKQEIIELLACTTMEEWAVMFEFSTKVAALPSIQKALAERKKRLEKENATEE